MPTTQEKPRPKALLFIYGLYFSLLLASELIETGLQSVDLPSSFAAGDGETFKIAATAVVLSLFELAATSFRVAFLAQVFATRLDAPGQLSLLRRAELVGIETIRALAAVIVRLPLLILPAFFEWIRLSAVTPIIVLSRAYQNGEVDALKQARQIFSRHPWLVTALMLPSVGVWLLELVVASSVQNSSSITEAPVSHLLAIAIFAAIHIAAEVFVLSTYRRRILEVT